MVTRLLRPLLEPRTDVLLVLDGQGQVLLCNRICEQRSGIPADLVEGRALWDGPLGDGCREDLAEFFDGGGGQRSLVRRLELRRDDGGRLPILASLHPVLSETGALEALLVTDIEHEKTSGSAGGSSSEDDIGPEARMLQALGAMARGAAHDFNNSLTAIFGYMDLARSTLDPNHPAVNSLDKAVRAAHSASAVTRSLLAYVRQEEGLMSEIDLVEVVRETMGLLRRLLPSSVSVSEDLPKDSRIRVLGDSIRIQRLLLGLAVSAREVLPSGGELRLTLSADPSGPGPAGQAELSLALLPGEAEAGRASRERRNRNELPRHLLHPVTDVSLLHEIARAHDGEFFIEELERGGQRFVMTLPLRGESPPRDLAGEPESDRTIIVAEDDEFVRSILISSLRRASWQVVSASDGEEAMARFAQHADARPVVILDLDLPRKSGLECFREIRKSAPGTPIVLITGDAHAEVSPELDKHARGNIEMLKKPFHMADLLEAVHRTRVAREDEESAT